ncbi:hypothetical protein [Pseudomonas sp. LS-2]|uniref:hypothetical protein n=1 Tax=Pseudomonas sp. LS-2 TaxID=2315859 RepID=UPI000E771692|nr:hypothetical protein [Pseudomonas sp. LS-2]RJX72655.1 hypothetical protein D3M70_31125 [Pseudomonas sp. LS-2]
MSIYEDLIAAGLSSVATALPTRLARMNASGIICEAYQVLSDFERATLASSQCRMRLRKVSSIDELEEHCRLVNLLVLYTSETRNWLLTLPLQRLQLMLEAVEATW